MSNDLFGFTKAVILSNSKGYAGIVGKESQQAEITRLNEVVKEYEIDAKRYRWLKCEGKEIVICRWNKSGCTEMFVDAIDKNIDQAMSEKGDEALATVKEE